MIEACKGSINFIPEKYETNGHKVHAPILKSIVLFVENYHNLDLFKEHLRTIDKEKLNDISLVSIL